MPDKLTITEALAEIKTIDKRLTKKRSFVGAYIVRQDKLKDPLAGDGGSEEAIRRERQAIADLEQRVVDLRLGIQSANSETEVTINGQSRSVAEWLVWRRDVAPGAKDFLNDLSRGLKRVRDEAQSKGFAMTQSEAASPDDLIVNINEAELAQEIEGFEETLGALDGQLSLKNATVFIEV